MLGGRLPFKPLALALGTLGAGLAVAVAANVGGENALWWLSVASLLVMMLLYAVEDVAERDLWRSLQASHPDLLSACASQEPPRPVMHNGLDMLRARWRRNRAARRAQAEQAGRLNRGTLRRALRDLRVQADPTLAAQRQTYRLIGRVRWLVLLLLLAALTANALLWGWGV